MPSPAFLIGDATAVAREGGSTIAAEMRTERPCACAWAPVGFCVRRAPVRYAASAVSVVLGSTDADFLRARVNCAGTIPRAQTAAMMTIDSV